MAERPITPRTVKPRKPYTADLPIIAAAPDVCFSERTGELHPRSELPGILADHPSAYVATGNPERLLAELERELGDDPLWQFRLTPLERERMVDGEIRRHREIVVNFFGFRRPNGHRRNRYFYPLAPMQYCRRNIRELVDPSLPYWRALLVWAESVRAFCQAHELRPSPTAGGVAAQLLRHPRFYPEPRRKVPTATNERARPALPGNCYELRAETDRLYGAALYIDQADAHHSAAESIDLPHADDLRARGRFRTCDGGPWIRPRTPAWSALMRTHGLLLVAAEIPHQVGKARYIPPEWERRGDRLLWVYTNELEELRELGIRIRWASAAWTSRRVDTGLQEYARWAKREHRSWGEAGRWIKPTLLASYGILAAKPRPMTFGFRQAESGEEERWLVASELIDVRVRRTKRALQSPIANVIQRGMIEAETRRRSLNLARTLERDGIEVFAVYADAVLVRDTRGADPLPLLPKPWRVKERLSWVRFYSPQAFDSREISRLPGVPRSRLEESRNGTPTNRRNACPQTSTAPSSPAA